MTPGYFFLRTGSFHSQATQSATRAGGREGVEEEEGRCCRGRGVRPEAGRGGQHGKGGEDEEDEDPALGDQVPEEAWQ